MVEDDIDFSPLLAGRSGRALLVRGTRLGGSIDDIPRDVLLPQYHSSSKLPDSGWIYGAGMSWYAEAGTLTRISIFQPHVAQLGIAREHEVTSTFGPTMLVERGTGLITYHYAGRSFAAMWNRHSKELAAVLLGEVTFQERTYDARFLVRLLASYAPGGSPRKPDPIEEPFAHFHYQRVEALAKAFGLGSVEDAFAGFFVTRRAPQNYTSIIERLRKFEDYTHEIPLWQIEGLYRDLLGFRRAANLSSSHAGAIEMGILYARYSDWLTSRAVDALEPYLTEIDEILARLIDPEGRILNEHDLASHFSFPLDEPDVEQ